jgi:hypothetical protein
VVALIICLIRPRMRAAASRLASQMGLSTLTTSSVPTPDTRTVPINGYTYAFKVFSHCLLSVLCVLPSRFVGGFEPTIRRLTCDAEQIESSLPLHPYFASQPATILLRIDWHSGLNRALLC